LKSLMLLWIKLAEESANRCCTSVTMDIKTVHRRVEHEGLSFLTITLPTFGKDFQKSLDQGYISHRQFQGFSFTQRTGGLPTFLSGFLGLVFDRASGVLLDDPSKVAILAVRQLTLAFSKILLECSDARVQDAFDQFIKCEESVRDTDKALSDEDLSDFLRLSDMLYASIFSRIDRKVYYGQISLKHGPGSTADKLRGNAKFRQSTWPERLEEVFPSGEYLIPNWRYIDQLDAVDILEPGKEIPVKVVSVPKSLKTPRIIGMEPTAMQYAQQGLLPEFLEGLGSARIPRSVLGFDDQTPNQRLAREGSISGELATLDLSEASDRVSNQLVRSMMRNHPHLLGAVDACRSRKADVRGHGVIRLAKFASMGSALTFPIEAMVFLTLVLLGVERELNTHLDPKSAFRILRGQTRIYGDDIIVPVKYVRTVVDVLHTFGCVVNVGKSYWNGKFRESCGKEYYDGFDVSIVKVRRMFPTRRQDASGVISLVSLRNQLFEAGYYETCVWLDREVRKVISHYPRVLPSSPVLGRHEFGMFDSEYVDGNLHVPLVKGYVVSSEPPRDPLDGPEALLKYLTKRSDLPFADVRHLERSGRPQRVNIKLRKSKPY
jgi:hypothetical protein